MPRVRVTVPVGDFVCPVCEALAPHELSGGEPEPLPHLAPCGRPCARGGVGRVEYLIGKVHRTECEECDSDE